jgi:hypothetical protein
MVYRYITNTEQSTYVLFIQDIVNIHKVNVRGTQALCASKATRLGAVTCIIMEF